jgi:hypothetical protein
MGSNRPMRRVKGPRASECVCEVVRGAAVHKGSNDSDVNEYRCVHSSCQQKQASQACKKGYFSFKCAYFAFCADQNH